MKVTNKKTNTTTTSPYFNKSVPTNLGDILENDLRVVFVGINPGLTSAMKGHHFAGPTNHFWPCLSESGLVDRKVTYEDDVRLPETYQLGFTNLTPRPTRTASELSLSEQRAGIPLLTEKISRLRPRVVCFIGKGIYEIYSREKCKELGLQKKTIPWLSQTGESAIFVIPSTSGIVSAYKKTDKMSFFKDLFRVTEDQLQKYPISERRNLSCDYSLPIK
ncbi:uracil-DNA glycosylase-like protein [Pilobolus umbonatus]|nr:uracil-DNA glycosylase-like protein [Pilobolus umbonatus]